MEAAELTHEGFWSGDRAVVLAPPGLEEAGRVLEGRLTSEEWARGAVVFASSGSGGVPKWILLRREALLCSAREVNRHLEVGTEDRWFLALPEIHVGGFGVAARSFAAGCGFAVLEGRWGAEQFRNAVEASGATHTSLVPTQVFDLVDGGWRCPETLRAVVVGGGALDNRLGQRARDLGWPVLQSYGMTEAGSQVATAGLDSLDGEFRNAPLPVMRHWELRSEGDGILALRGAALFDGYVTEHDGGLCCERPGQDGWFVTTDLVDVTGGELTFVGRSDRVVKVLGELVNLTDLEARVRDESALDCRIVTVRDERSGVRLVPVFEKELPPDAAAAWVAGINATLPGYCRLSEAQVVGGWPRTAIGKVDMKGLEALLEQGGG